MVLSTYAYYPGCTLHTTAKEYDVSSRLVCQALNIQLQELEGWACCGAASAHSVDSLLGTVLPSRELQLAEEKKLPLAVACAMCFSRLKFAAHELADEANRRAVEEILGGKLSHIPQVVHLLPVLEGVKERFPLKKELKGLKVACYYGCLLVRPREVTQLDDDENPQLMDSLIQALGAEPVDWGFKTECCGASFVMARGDIVMKLSYRILSRARQLGADCVAVACPLCHSNLDTHQKEMAAKHKEKVEMPIFYFTQLLGLALGFSPKQLLLSKHFTDPVPLLANKGLL
jgi:heterodisulfide reductase subunit B